MALICFDQLMGIDVPGKIQELRLGRGVFSRTQTPRRGVDKDALDFALKTPSRTADLDTPHFPGYFSSVNPLIRCTSS